MATDPSRVASTTPAASAAPDATDDLVAVGAVGAAVGVRGDVTIICWTDDPDDRFAPGAVLTTEPEDVGPLTVTSFRRQGERLVVHFDGVEDRVPAEALRRTRLFVPASARPPLADPDEYYDSDLVGLRAVDPGGAGLGEVVRVEHVAGGDRLVLRAGDREHLVPFVAEMVPRVDLGAGVVEIDAPEGLFDL